MLLKRRIHNAKIKNIEGKTCSIIKPATNSAPDAKINEVKDEIPGITNLATTAGLTTIKNKIPNDSDLVKKANYDAIVSEMEKKNLILLIIRIS